MRKYTLLASLCAFALLGMVAAPLAFAKTDVDADAGQEQTDKPAKPELPAVPAALAALEKTDFVNGVKPDLKAKVYYIFKSRSTCGICVAEAPKLAAAYKKMKGKGAELIMINGDQTAADAKKWVAKAKMKFPVISPECTQRRSIPFPYSGAQTLPLMVAVDADGNVLGQANASKVESFVEGWKDLVKEQKAKKKDK